MNNIDHWQNVIDKEFLKLFGNSTSTVSSKEEPLTLEKLKETVEMLKKTYPKEWASMNKSKENFYREMQ